MLNKVKIGAVIAVVLMVAKAFVPDLDIPEGLEDSLMLVIVFVAQFFIKETPTTVAGLKLNK